MSDIIGEVRPSIDALAVAQTLLASAHLDHATLWVREFADDAEAHDDDLQARLELDFIAAFEIALADIAAKYGAPKRLYADCDEHSPVPFGGVFRLAVWQIRDSELWLGAGHEDREVPFVLMLGCAYRDEDDESAELAWTRR